MRKNKKSHAIIVGVLAVLVIATGLLLVCILLNKKEFQPRLNAMNEEQEISQIQQKEISIYLPETCYAAVGVPLEIYNSQITDQCSGISSYNVLWSCDIGENLERKYSLNATEEMLGEHELTVSIYDNALNLLAERSCKLNVVDKKNFDEIAIYQVEDLKDFSAEDIEGDAVKLFLQADNAETARENAEYMITAVENIRSINLTIPVYVANVFYQEIPALEEFQLMMQLEEKLEIYENVYLVPVGICVDSEYNYDAAQSKINEAGNSQIEDLFTAVICGTNN